MELLREVARFRHLQNREFNGRVGRIRRASETQRLALAPVKRVFEMERQTALLAEDAGEAINAMVRWGLAAQATDDKLERLEVLVAARHQAVWAAVWARPKRNSWREIAPLTGIPWQTLYRRYRHRPERLPRASFSIDHQGSVGSAPM
jgi:hypothetical protein